MWIWAILYVPTIILTSIPWADSWEVRMVVMLLVGLAGLVYMGVRWDLLAVTGSNFFGKFAQLPIPKWFRPYYYKFWIRVIKAQKEFALGWEGARELDEYRTLAELFIRKLKPGVRPICKGKTLCSPVDGAILTCGVVRDYKMGAAKVKGHSYSLLQFLGFTEAELSDYKEKRDILNQIAQQYGKLGIPKGEQLAKEFLPQSMFTGAEGGNLYYCVIYLRPKDYHRVHSAAEWDVEKRRHFPGSLFPVNKIATTYIPELFALNERVALLGSWEHGFFSSTAVGAFNVGSITTSYEPGFRTNRLLRNVTTSTENIRYFSLKGLGSYFEEKVYDESIPVKKGDEQFIFNAGSTVVLVFEAPSSFKFTVGAEEEVKMGVKMGSWD